jgi:hypothetical protein
MLGYCLGMGGACTCADDAIVCMQICFIAGDFPAISLDDEMCAISPFATDINNNMNTVSSPCDTNQNVTCSC